VIEGFFRLLTDGLFRHPLEFIKSPWLTNMLTLLALDWENSGTEDAALWHLLNEIWHVVRSVNEFIQNIYGSFTKCLKNIIYSPIQGRRRLSSLARLSVSSIERYEYSCFIWAIGDIFGQFGQRNTVHKNRFVRQCIDTTKGNPYV